MTKEGPKPNLGASSGLARLSRGATTLLAIAQENDKHKVIATNEALRLSLRLTSRLQALCVDANDDGVRRLLARDEIPEKWFEFCVALVDGIELEIQRSKNSRDSGFSLQTDFDRSVYMALGQTLADILREQRGARLTLEVSSTEVMNCLRKVSGRRLQELLLKNYIGNILQDLFDACKVRLTTKNLARDTESKLREKDAELLARLAFAELGDTAIVDEDRLIQVIRALLAEVWQMDATLE